MPHVISINYNDLSSRSMVQIFEAADALGLPPAEVAQLYLAAVATDATDHNNQQAPEPALADA